MQMVEWLLRAAMPMVAAIGARYSGASESTSAPGTLAINTLTLYLFILPGAGNSGGPSRQWTHLHS